MCASWVSGQDGLYDNVTGKGRPQKKRGGGTDEDIYGGLGEREEGLYDNTRGEKGMKYSEDGLYDNPHNMGENTTKPRNVCVVNVLLKESVCVACGCHGNNVRVHTGGWLGGVPAIQCSGIFD